MFDSWTHPQAQIKKAKIKTGRDLLSREFEHGMEGRGQPRIETDSPSTYAILAIERFLFRERN
jgi:hypothetical protein